MTGNKFVAILFAIIVTAPAYPQGGKFTHPSTLELHFCLSDYRSNTPFSNPKNMFGGLGISFTKGINNHFDYRISLNGTFADSISKKQSAANEKELLLTGDITIRARMFGEARRFQPYLLAGAGVSNFKDKFGAYIPAGFGLQVSLLKDAHLVISSQYRFGLTNSINNHFFYSFGLAGTIGKKKRPIPVRPKDPIEAPINLAARDRDHDGIVDTADACPDVPGYSRYKGCQIPDTDKDGTNDEEDKCIQVPGPRENAGCPIIKKEIKDRVDLAAKQIFFQTGSAELLPVSFKALDEVAAILVQNPTLTLSIEGHTDNVGTPASNQVLSENRARSVLQYLQSRNIAPNRLQSKGFGQSQPIANNESPEGRALNRRVELKLSN